MSSNTNTAIIDICTCSQGKKNKFLSTYQKSIVFRLRFNLSKIKIKTRITPHYSQQEMLRRTHWSKPFQCSSTLPSTPILPIILVIYCKRGSPPYPLLYRLLFSIYEKYGNTFTRCWIITTKSSTSGTHCYLFRST